MCEAVLFDYLGQLKKSFFNNPLATLPVISSFERIKFVPWGRHQSEQNVDFPIGDTLLRDEILKGMYDLFSPKAVQLPVIKFLEKNNKDTLNWYEVIKGFFMQGVLLNHCNQLRVYVVTIRPITLDASYNYWPRLLCQPSFTSTSPTVS